MNGFEFQLKSLLNRFPFESKRFMHPMSSSAETSVCLILMLNLLLDMIYISDRHYLITARQHLTVLEVTDIISSTTKLDYSLDMLLIEFRQTILMKRGHNLAFGTQSSKNAVHIIVRGRRALRNAWSDFRLALKETRSGQNGYSFKGAKSLEHPISCCKKSRLVNSFKVAI